MNEMIDREATVKQICKMGEMVGGHDRDVVIAIALFVQDDKTAFPTVERPHGEWIPKDLHNCWTKFECSVCGFYHEPVHDFGKSKPDFNFCPHCGAKLKREGETE